MMMITGNQRDMKGKKLKQDKNKKQKTIEAQHDLK